MLHKRTVLYQLDIYKYLIIIKLIIWYVIDMIVLDKGW